MGLITGLLGLPVAPLRGAVAAAEQVRRQAEETYYDPARIRAQLEEVERRRTHGELTRTRPPRGRTRSSSASSRHASAARREF